MEQLYFTGPQWLKIKIVDLYLRSDNQQFSVTMLSEVYFLLLGESPQTPFVLNYFN